MGDQGTRPESNYTAIGYAIMEFLLERNWCGPTSIIKGISPNAHAYEEQYDDDISPQLYGFHEGNSNSNRWSGN